MGGHAFGEAATLPGIPAGGLHGAGGQMQMRTPGGKQPGFAGVQDAAVGAEDFQQAGGEHGVTVFASFAMLDAQEHAVAVDIGDFEGDCLGDAESGSVAGQQHGAVLDAVDVVEKALDLIGGEDDGEFFIQAGTGEVMLLPRQLQGDQVQELDGGDEGIDGLRRELALLGEMELVLTDGFEVEFRGVAVEILGEFGDIMDVASLRSGGEVADAHVFDHALT